MNYKYTKSVKEHIAQMAVRKKYLSLFNLKLAKLKSDLTVKAEKLGDHLELSKLPIHLHSNFIVNEHIPNNYNIIFRVNQHIALQSFALFRTIELDSKVFVHSKKLKELLDGREILEFKKFLDEINLFESQVQTALGSYSTYKKAVVALPWIESLHPDFAKTPTCKIVPIDTINKVNKLMGVK